MISAVVDTNVAASALVRFPVPTPPVRVLVAGRQRLFTLILSEQIFAELTRTLEQPYFRLRLTEAQRSEGVESLRRVAMVVQITANVKGVATHPEDDLILATAVSADADYLVTFDQGLLRLLRYQDVAIVSPKEFLDVLAADARRQPE